jgi:hypothetical protein
MGIEMGLLRTGLKQKHLQGITLNAMLEQVGLWT